MLHLGCSVRPRSQVAPDRWEKVESDLVAADPPCDERLCIGDQPRGHLTLSSTVSVRPPVGFPSAQHRQTSCSGANRPGRPGDRPAWPRGVRLEAVLQTVARIRSARPFPTPSLTSTRPSASPTRPSRAVAATPAPHRPEHNAAAWRTDDPSSSRAVRTPSARSRPELCAKSAPQALEAADVRA